MSKSLVNVLITGDVKGLKNALGEADGAFKTFGKVAGAAVVGVAGAFAAAAYAAKPLIGAASDLAETQSKVGVVFGDVADQINDFAKTAAKNFGQSEQQALDAAATFATFGKGAGLAGEELATFSTDFVALASDLASFNNTTPEEAIEAIGAALRGESEPIRKYGVLLNDAALRQHALELGIYDGNGALTAQQKVLAAQAAIFAQTGDAQGDFERTSDGLANKQRILQAQLANVSAEIGSALLPIVLELANFIGDKVIPVIEHVAKVFGEEGLTGVVGMAAGFIKEEGPKALDALGEMLGKLARYVVDVGLPWLLDELEKLGKALVEWIRPRIGPMLEAIGEFIGKAANWLIDTGLPLLVDKLVELGNALVEWIGPNIEPMLKELGKFLAKLLEWILTEAIPKISKEALKLAGALLAWVAELLPQALAGLGSFILELVKAIPGLFVDLVDAMFSAGKDLGKFLIDGLIAGLGAIVDVATDIGKSIADAVWNAIKGAWNTFVAGPVNSAVRVAVDTLDKLLGPTINFPTPGDLIPKLAEGGIVNKPTLALIGEAGPEAVVPLSGRNTPNLGGGSITINVAGSVISERDLVETVRRGLIDAQRSGKQVVYAA